MPSRLSAEWAECGVVNLISESRVRVLLTEHFGNDLFVANATPIFMSSWVRADEE